jgi:hypothetical protein
VTEVLHGGVGGLQFPFDAGDVDARALAFRDPAQLLLLELITAAVNYEMGQAWVRVCDSLPSTSPLSDSRAPVADMLPAAVTAELLQARKTAFPLLTVARIGEAEWEWVGEDFQVLKQQWAVSWTLGPSDVAMQLKLAGALPRFAAIVAKICANRGHPSYRDGDVLFGGERFTLIDKAEVISSQGGVAQQEGGPEILGTTVVVRTYEREFDTTDHLDDALGLDLYENLGVDDPIDSFVVDTTT